MENIDKKHTHGNDLSDQDILTRVAIPWRKTRKEAWEEVSSRIGNRTSQPAGIRYKLIARWTIAASLLVLTCSGIFQALYTRSISTGNSEERTISFNDGSTVKLNAESRMSWHPGRWKFARKVSLSGEGYFEVTPGHTFSVRSENGITTVLGTSFNILARENRYEVSCLKGKVKVESTVTDDAVILQPDDQASLNVNGKLDLKRVQELEKQITWVRNEWTYTDEPLINVIHNIEIQYNIKIIMPAGDSHRFTGGFEKAMPLQDVLDLVCTPFAYTFTKKANGEFEIHHK